MRTLLCFFCLAFMWISCKKEDTVRQVQPPATNKAPVANAGEDATIYIPETSYTLDGGKSFDPDKESISYSWRQISGPQDSSFSQNRGNVLVTVRGEGRYEFELKVTDRWGISDLDTMMLTVIDEFALGKAPVLSLICDSTMLPSDVGSFDLMLNAYVNSDQGQRFNITSGISARQIQGPPAAAIQDVYADNGRAGIPITNLRIGTYRFQVEVERKGIVVYDTATLVVVRDTLQGKELIFETKWEKYADRILAAKTPVKQDVFYIVPFRKTEVFVLFKDDPVWYKADYGWNTWNELIYVSNSCHSTIEVFQISDFDYGSHGVGDRVKIKVKYL